MYSHDLLKHHFFRLLISSFKEEVFSSKNYKDKLISILIVQDSGSFLERRALGVDSVIIEDSKEAKNITNLSWGYQVIVG